MCKVCACTQTRKPGPCYLAQTTFQLEDLLTPPPRHWNQRHGPSAFLLCCHAPLTRLFYPSYLPTSFPLTGTAFTTTTMDTCALTLSYIGFPFHPRARRATSVWGNLQVSPLSKSVNSTLWLEAAEYMSISVPGQPHHRTHNELSRLELSWQGQLVLVVNFN